MGSSGSAAACRHPAVSSRIRESRSRLGVLRKGYAVSRIVRQLRSVLMIRSQVLSLARTARQSQIGGAKTSQGNGSTIRRSTRFATGRSRIEEQQVGDSDQSGRVHRNRQRVQRRSRSRHYDFTRALVSLFQFSVLLNTEHSPLQWAWSRSATAGFPGNRLERESSSFCRSSSSSPSTAILIRRSDSNAAAGKSYPLVVGKSDESEFAKWIGEAQVERGV